MADHTRPIAAAAPTTRRTALTALALASAALVVPKLAKAATTPVPADHPDAALFAMVPRIEAVTARLDAACDRVGASDLLRFAGKPTPDQEAAEAEEAAAGTEWAEMRDDLGQIPAKTLEGLRIKATFCPCAWDEAYMMESIVEDILAMTGGAA